ncbi:MAG: hypothetical protein AAFQ61_05805 [Cyanobacteria bacterium J06626_23]
MFHRLATRRPQTVLVTLFLLGGCAWVPESPGVNPPAVTAREPVAPPEEASTVPSANAPQVTNDNASTETETEAVKPTDCAASNPGQVIGFDEFYVATHTGKDDARLYISQAPGAAPGDSYGLAGDAVEVIATALDDTCTAWTWVKWPASDYRGWLPSASVAINS